MGKTKRNQTAGSLPARNGNNGSMAEVELRQEFSGPIPPPALLDGYERILPGAAERILTLAEDEAKHRRSIETLTRKAEIRLAKGEHYQIYVGQSFALIVTLAFVAGAVFLLYYGKSLSGSLLATGAFVAVVTAFLKRNNSKK